MKTQQIIELEKLLGFQLTETKDVEDLTDFQKSKTYLLNAKQEIIGLNLYDCQLKDISFLKGLSNLTTLYLYDNQISDISFLQGLSNLTMLNLSINQISDISFLKDLSNLTTLNLGGNKISDISFLQGLSNLTMLNLIINQISDISFLKDLSNLTSIDLGGNEISDISFLQGLSNLTMLYLDNNQISDISFLQGLSNLTTLNLYNNQISDFSFLQGLSNLTSIDLGANQISDISFLQGLSNLTSIDLSDNPISDISFLQGLSNLTSLNLSENKISDISFLQGLSNLTTLNLHSNKISVISFLQGLSNLTTLDLSYNHEISDYSFVQGLSNLTTLNLEYNKILDISFLQGLSNLTTLHLHYNKISDISFLQGLSNLTTLNLHSNKISDISFLQGLSNLTTLNLWNNQISDISLSFLDSFPKLKELQLYENPIQNIPKEIFDKEQENVLTEVRDYLIIPQQIIELEKLLGFQLTETKDVKDLTDFQKSKIYLLNAKQEIIGLNLYRCQLKDYSFLKGLSNLTTLNLRTNKISNFSFLQGLSNLTTLNLGYNQISDISFLQGLSNLTTLYLYNNPISDYSFLKGLSNLTTLNLSQNEVSDISFLQGLSNLTTLNLSDNQISDISFLQGLSNLTGLNLDGNKISDISFLQGLSNLTGLNLDGNKISDIYFLQGLSDLTELNLYDNRISDISFLQGLSNLTELNLMSNQISDISFLQGLSNLTTLNLHGNKISDFSFLQGLSNLTTLNLSSNKISDFSFVQGLSNLTTLYLGDNEISDISFLQGLSNLTTLNLWNNKISDISFLQGLSNLTELNLRSNQISDISFLQGLSNLTELYLGGNEISDISFLQGLSNLTELYLDGNQISDIYFLQGLSNLTTLNLSSNQISDISLSFLDSFPKLKKLQLLKNPIQNITKEIFDKQGNILDGVRNYLEGIAKGSTINNEVKVVFIGNGSVGKTQIAKRLAEAEDFVFDKQHDSTHAISLLRAAIDCNFIDEKLQLNLWDFGGQDLYHATHRLFMKTRALFVLVWDVENELNPSHTWEGTEYKNEELAYWLKYVSFFGGDGPILVVQNKVDTESQESNSIPEPERKKLQATFPTITDFWQCSAKTGYNFDKLSYFIAEAFEKNDILRQDLIKRKLPTDWIKVRERVRAEQAKAGGQKQITVDVFKAWCKEADTEKAWQTILSFFRDTGVLYYQEVYFSGTIILNQAWAIEAVYQVLDRKKGHYKILQQKQGQLDYTWLCKIWKTNTDGERELFIDFMLSTQLCFERTKNKEWNNPLKDRTFVVPQLLKANKPDYIATYISEQALNEKHTIGYPFLPTTFIHQFIIQAKNFAGIEDMWQSGIYLSYAGSYAVVEADYKRSQIIIHHNPNDNELKEAILEELEAISQDTSIQSGEGKEEGFARFLKGKKHIQTPNPKNLMDEKFKERLQNATIAEIPALLDLATQYFDRVPSHLKGTFNQIKSDFYDQANHFTLSGWKAKLLVLIGQFGFEIPIEAERPILNPETSQNNSNIENKSQTGYLLHSIPKKMQLENLHRCIIRVAFDKDTILKNLPELAQNPILKDNIRLTESMEVSFSESKYFEVKLLNRKKQLVEPESITEWSFDVTPLILGRFPLNFIAVIILPNGKKEVILTESVEVVVDAVPDGLVFEVSDLSITNQNHTTLQKVDLKTLYDTLNQKLNDEQLTLFCQLHYEAVHNNFSLGQSKTAKISALLDYAKRKNLFEVLEKELSDFLQVL